MEFVPINLKSSTADSKASPKIEWNNFDLKIEYKNWRDQLFVLNFFDVPHLKMLSSDEIEVSALSDDLVYEVKNSGLLANLIKCGEIKADEKFNHWLVGFNEIGSFVEVVFKTFEEK